jgi:hypothetical protein
MRPSFALALSLASSLLAGCGEGVPHAPEGPSGLITTATSVPMIEGTVSCAGPAASIAALGSLCSGSPTASYRSAEPTSGAMTIGASDDVPYLLVFGYPAAGSASGAIDPSELAYAAFLVTKRPSGGVVAAIEAWEDATPLSGALLSTAFSFEACSNNWVGGGTLEHGDVTLTLAWSAAIPC